MKLSIVLFSALIFPVCLKPGVPSPIDKLRWMIGTWQEQEGDETVVRIQAVDSGPRSYVSSHGS
jgi:hypothetical protein